MELETERLLLRPWQQSDAEALYNYAKDSRVGISAGWPPHTDVTYSGKVIRLVLSVPETYAICLKDNNRAVGSISLKKGRTASSLINIQENEAEIGYWIGVPFWGQGMVPEAVKRLMQHAFIEVGLQRLWGDILR